MQQCLGTISAHDYIQCMPMVDRVIFCMHEIGSSLGRIGNRYPHAFNLSGTIKDGRVTTILLHTSSESAFNMQHLYVDRKGPSDGKNVYAEVLVWLIDQ